jgi:predicted dehydrogenase
MSIKVAFAGFRHGHVQAMYQTAQRMGQVEIVACVDEDGPEAHGSSLPVLGVELTHESLDQVLAEVDFDVLACAEVYGRRGEYVIKALEAGKHAITDKPLCTTMGELQTIARLARERKLQVMVDLTMRYAAPYYQVAKIVQAGGIGELSSAMVTGLHPLAYGTRPMWYFEEGKQGGTLNDLMIHGVDLVRWASGKEFTKVIAATATCHRAPVPFFQDSAQVFYELEGGAKYLGDCSYMAPEGCPESWRFYLWGSEGSVRLSDSGQVEWYRAGEGEQKVEASEPPSTDPFEDFINSLHFGSARWLPNEECFRSSMAALAGQLAADTGERDMAVPVV